MIRRRLVLLALILAPAAAGAQNFDCREQAFDLSVVDPAGCMNAADLATCGVSCTRPADAAVPAQCFVLPLSCTDPADPSTCTAVPEELTRLPNTTRAIDDQPLLRRVTVHSGPHTDTVLSKVAINEIADAVFRAARERLCVPSPPPPSPTPPPSTGDPGDPPPAGSGPGLGGGTPGIIGGNPGIVGGDPGIYIRR